MREQNVLLHRGLLLSSSYLLVFLSHKLFACTDGNAEREYGENESYQANA